MQINSEDVANSTHDRCVYLMKTAGDTLILKVTKPAGHVDTLPQASTSVPGDVSFPGDNPFHVLCCFFNFLTISVVSAFSAVMLLVGQQEGHTVEN